MSSPKHPLALWVQEKGRVAFQARALGYGVLQTSDEKVFLSRSHARQIAEALLSWANEEEATPEAAE